MNLLIVDKGILDPEGKLAHFIEVFDIPVLVRAALAGNRAGAEKIVVETSAKGPELEKITALINRYEKLDGKVEIIPEGSSSSVSGNNFSSVFSHEVFEDAVILGDEGLRVEITNKTEAEAYESTVLKNMRLEKRSMDGTVDKYFNRQISTRLAKLVVKTQITPNQITFMNIVAGVISALLFATTGYVSAIVASIFFQLSTVLDCMDGDIARLKYMESKLGRTMDSFGDYFVHVAIFLALGFRYYNIEGHGYYIGLGISAALGAALSAIFLYNMKYVYLDNHPEKADTKLAQQFNKVIDTMATRDFSVLMIIFAVLSWLKVMLWMLAIGSHSFWMVLAYFQVRILLEDRRG